MSPIGPALAIFTFLLPSPEFCAGDFSGRVLGISDGDSIRVMHDGKGEKIRLYGIDAPEKGQAFGNKAKQFVSALGYGKEVKVEVKDQDRYGRTVAEGKKSESRNCGGRFCVVVQEVCTKGHRV